MLPTNNYGSTLEVVKHCRRVSWPKNRASWASKGTSIFVWRRCSEWVSLLGILIETGFFFPLSFNENTFVSLSCLHLSLVLFAAMKNCYLWCFLCFGAVQCCKNQNQESWFLLETFLRVVGVACFVWTPEDTCMDFCSASLHFVLQAKDKIGSTHSV